MPLVAYHQKDDPSYGETKAESFTLVDPGYREITFLVTGTIAYIYPNDICRDLFDGFKTTGFISKNGYHSTDDAKEIWETLVKDYGFRRDEEQVLGLYEQCYGGFNES